MVLKKGDPVTVVMWNGSIIKAEVLDPEPDQFTKKFRAQSEGTRTTTTHHLSYDDEGDQWCRGHEGEDVDALMAAEAMADKTQPMRPKLRPDVPLTGRWSSGKRYR